MWRSKGLGVGFAYPYPKRRSWLLRGACGRVRKSSSCAVASRECVFALAGFALGAGAYSFFHPLAGAGAQLGLARVLLLSAVGARLVASLIIGEL